MRPWLLPINAGVLAALFWTFPWLFRVVRVFEPLDPGVSGTDELVRNALVLVVREGAAAFFFGFAGACAALAYRNSLALRRELFER